MAMRMRHPTWTRGNLAVFEFWCFKSFNKLFKFRRNSNALLSILRRCPFWGEGHLLLAKEISSGAESRGEKLSAGDSKKVLACCDAFEYLEQGLSSDLKAEISELRAKANEF